VNFGRFSVDFRLFWVVLGAFWPPEGPSEAFSAAISKNVAPEGLKHAKCADRDSDFSDFGGIWGPPGRPEIDKNRLKRGTQKQRYSEPPPDPRFSRFGTENGVKKHLKSMQNRVLRAPPALNGKT